ncbi:MAG: ABC transporter ATP-binding protein [Hoeflea sp.]|uniref:ABC transporter ATP-binding protein n=1 Tax=Hoeflea sp. TaxID=1940281 RepID=UPI001DF67161|nr:ABC transporter ATP-binding protein [Hoeflea sp.]MBU4531329.1 ABC transporter ATP-binding protein [Alphaproteobacteria bacterium]MBU4544186.1 ABC transporter ATP-binding protein [Alphaproteobacteria bacterium]MBU4550577.1 ABC transporter ATP-binding protein [Alphaproteobacteria bacterium]MBV1724605.1 ABC transporter ATP-binding protein [Hoeflea sp.]MBV1760625.1 ABC transporter ATP-binding protein [Hoeflea sp.]
MALIDIEDLEVVFGSGGRRVHALRGVSLSVEEGESFGIVGESGSGKSTVLRAACGLAPVTGGRILIDGKQVTSPRDAAFYRRVQMVFQDPYASLHPRHTIDRVLSEPLAIHGFDRREARVEQALDEVGLGKGFRFRYPHQLSGGQRQRVAIARALILEPKVILLDEPTSALDASIQAEVLNLLDRLRDERGLTYVLVSHDLAVVSHMCERLMVMQNGQVVEQLTREALQARATTKDYTRNLLTASEGFTRDPALQT